MAISKGNVVKYLLLLVLVSCSGKSKDTFTVKQHEFLRCLCTSYYKELSSAKKKADYLEVSCIKEDDTLETFEFGYSEWVKPCNENFRGY